MATEIEGLEWKCPNCGFHNLLELDEETPFEDICGNCDFVYRVDYLEECCNAQP